MKKMIKTKAIVKSSYTLIIGLMINTFLFTGVNLKAQIIQLMNGTETTANYIDTVEKYIPEENNFIPDTADFQIGINVYKIRNVDGSLNISDVIIQEAINVANQYFSQASIQFYIMNEIILDDYNYTEIISPAIIDELTGLYSQENAINLYLVNFALDSLFYGFTYYPDEPEKNYIFLKKTYLAGNYLTTLLGNFFGLLPTHEQMGGAEYVDGTNCDLTGDYICDTYADPNLYNNVIPATCSYNGYLRDAHNEFYVPSVANIMSESTDNCKCILSAQQYKRIQYYYKKFRYYLK